MMGFGWSEILIILVVALLVVGPNKLPQVAKTVGRTVRQIRQVTGEMGRALEAEANSITRVKPLSPVNAPKPPLTAEAEKPESESGPPAS